MSGSSHTAPDCVLPIFLPSEFRSSVIVIALASLSKLTADQFCPCQHIAPLVITAELQVTSVVLEQLIEIIRLHDHVVKLQETQSFFHSLLVTLCCQHTVYTEKCGPTSRSTFNIIQIQQPVRIVHHQRFAFREINKLAHLLLKTVTVVLDLLRRHHASHIRSSRRISDICLVPPPIKCNWFISCYPAVVFIKHNAMK